MPALTTRQRDLLQLLLDADAPLGTSALAEKLKLTPRQVQYDLDPLGEWLAQKGIELQVTPGVGVSVRCPAEQRRSLTAELDATTNLLLVLSHKQRQQLLALALLTAKDPLTLFELQQHAQVGRTTIIHDLAHIEPWLNEHGLRLERRPNVGLRIQGREAAQRQALLALLWGDPAFGEPLTHVTHADGLTFNLADERRRLPLVNQAYTLIRKWDTRKSATLVAEAETQLGGRFSDDAVPYLALAFTLQAERVQGGRTAEDAPAEVAWLQTLKAWPVANRIAGKLGWLWPAKWPVNEIAWLAAHLLAAPRNESWPSDPAMSGPYTDLADEMMQLVAETFDIAGLSQDQTLREGIVNHVIPACLRQRFGLPMLPVVHTVALGAAEGTEEPAARRLAALIHARIGVVLPENEINGLRMLLRAAYIRERQDYVRNVIVVCPSGMATAQLLVARLKAHFPRLGTYRVISLRELGKEETEAANLIITTVPLPAVIKDRTSVIQVHPLLLPQDIQNITQWLA